MGSYWRSATKRLSGAEWSVPVNTTAWTRYLASFPVALAVEDGRISRAALLGLADHARPHPRSQASLNLFFNVLAWGIAGNWRNVGRIITAVAADTITGLLVEAAAPPTPGILAAAFRVVTGHIPSWGPAFFTKYLHFTSDTSPAKVPCLILDDRVRLAWRCLAGEWLDRSSSSAYQRYCA